MSNRSTKYTKQTLNQFINFFWTILSFAPIVWFWIREGINIYFYFFVAVSLIIAVLPLGLFTLSSGRRIYERLGVKQIRKFVQNGAIVNAKSNEEKQSVITGI